MKKVRITPVALAVAIVTVLSLSSSGSASGAVALGVVDGAVLDSGGSAFTQAAGHPHSASVSFALTTNTASGPPLPDAALKNLRTGLPPGFIGNPTAVPVCRGLQDLIPEDIPGSLQLPKCPLSSQVGIATVAYTDTSAKQIQAAVYNLAPPPGAAAAFAFQVAGFPVLLTASLRSDGDYGVSVKATNVTQAISVREATVTLWGVPADSSHDNQRCLVYLGSFTTCIGPPGSPIGPNPADTTARALIANPTRCTSPGVGLATTLRAEYYQRPGEFDEAGFFSHEPPGFPLDSSAWGPEVGTTGCDAVPFDPRIEVEPTNHRADSPTGLNVEITVPTDGLLSPSGIAQSNLRTAVVTLPKGMSVNPSSADGLGGCSPSQLAAETAFSPPGSGCPNDSKIGTVEVETPLLNVPLKGSVFLAEQYDNPFGSLLAIYIVVKHAERGVIVKLEGRVDTDSQTGQLVTTFDDNPQLPFSSLHLELKSGPRAPLVNPPSCGTYTSASELSPWARPDQPALLKDSFQVNEGPDGAGCPDGDFNPSFEGGTTVPIAGAFSPLIVRASRPDGSQQLTTLAVDLPPGLVGKLKGIATCPDDALAIASTKSGKAEISSPSCPAGSIAGSVDVGAGAGSDPFHVEGSVHLAGPYKGAPLSLAVITPAVAGPLDLGTVVVRVKAEVSPRSGQIRVISDPIPTILQGIPLHIRSVQVDTPRPDFTLNPTSCDPMSLDGTLVGAATSKAFSSRFQVGACDALGFRPNLRLQLRGGTRRGDHPALRATLTARPGDANIARAQVALARSALLDQAHIRTVCTRVQFAADSCPSGSIYGRAEAISPLLEQPLSGPVYLRSSDNPLPDLVAGLRGPDSQPIQIELVGRTDAVKGALRNTFEAAPDAPISKFTLELFGGKRGLVQNSRDLCAHRYRATVRLNAHNGKIRDVNPVLTAKSCKSKRRKSSGGR